MMTVSVFHNILLLCSSLAIVKGELARYYYDYECNEPLVEGAKLTATSSLRDRGPDNAKLYERDPEIGIIRLQVNIPCKNIVTYLWRTINTKPIRVLNIITMEKVNMRWAFNTSTWQPTADQLMSASSYIQTEEKQRISRFVFQDDAKSSLIGRLLLRRFTKLTSLIPYENIRFGRDDRGKPFLQGAGDISVNFNVSHQGDYVVLAGNNGRNIGIDIMKIEPPANKNIPEMFRLMSRQFSEHEWSTIYSYATEALQIACFYRMWCLKESYVKNIGLGISIPLDKISFAVKSPLKIGEIATDTKLYVNNVLKSDWRFEETLLDEKHAVATSLQVDKDEVTCPVTYEFLSFDDIVKEAKPLVEPDIIFVNNFLKKKSKN